jgi:hypothetical protein
MNAREGRGRGPPVKLQHFTARPLLPMLAALVLAAPPILAAPLVAAGQVPAHTAITSGALAVGIAVRVFLPAFAVVADALCATVAIGMARLAMLVAPPGSPAGRGRRRLALAGAVEADELSATLGRRIADVVQRVALATESVRAFAADIRYVDAGSQEADATVGSLLRASRVVVAQTRTNIWRTAGAK